MTLCVWATLIRSTEQHKRQSYPLAGYGRVVRYDGFVLLDGRWSGLRKQMIKGCWVDQRHD